MEQSSDTRNQVAILVDSPVDFVIGVWCDAPVCRDCWHDMTTNMKEALDASGGGIPFLTHTTQRADAARRARVRASAMSAAADAPVAEVTIRRATPDEDWHALHGLLTRAFAFMAGRIDPPSSLNRLDVAGLARKAGEEICLVAEIGGRLAGCVFCRPDGDHLYIGKLAVEPGLQNRGLGRRLVAAAEEEARRLGLPALELETRIELVENHAAFARMGFVKTGESAHPGFDRPTSISMRKML